MTRVCIGVSSRPSMFRLRYSRSGHAVGSDWKMVGSVRHLGEQGSPLRVTENPKGCVASLGFESLDFPEI